MKGGLVVRVEGDRVVELAAQPPVAAKILEGPFGPELVLVGSAAGLLEGDEVTVHLTLGRGAHLTVRSTAATLAHPCPGGGSTTSVVRATLGQGATLAWLVEPLVACAGCRHVGRSLVRLAPGARAVWYEAVSLGRSGEEPGAVALRLDVTLGGRPLLADGLRAGPGSGATSPAVLGPHRHAGAVHLLGHRPGLAVPGAMALAAPGATVRAVSPDAAALERRLAPARRAFLVALHDPLITNPPGEPAGVAKEALTHG